MHDRGLRKSHAGHEPNIQLTGLACPRPPMSGEVIIGAVAVALDRAAKVQRDKFVQTLRFSSRVPLKEHVFTRPMRHPQITQARLQ